MKPTAAQQRALEHRGSDLLVAASAGSGKTETLARRCAALLAGDSADAAEPGRACEVTELLVVTFTRAAAAELRARVDRILRLRAEAERDPQRRAHLQRQVLLLPSAEIGTLDAWCGRLVREFYAEAEIDAGFTILGAEEEALLRAKCLEDLFEAIYSTSLAVADMDSGHGPDERLPIDTVREARAWLQAHPRASDEFLRELIRLLNEQRGKVLNPESWLARVAAAASGQDAELRQRATEHLVALVREECHFQAEELQALLGQSASSTPAADVARLAVYAEKLRNWAGRLAERTVCPETLSTVAFEIAAIRSDLPRASAIEKLVTERWYQGRLLKCADPTNLAALIEQAPLAARRLRTLLALEAAYQRRVLAAKRTRQAWGFEDIQRRALDLLGVTSVAADPDEPRTPTPLAERLRRRYAHVLVDEYQDTSPLQVELLRLVTRDNGFFVGDVKQSIYGFRRAEPRLFSELAEAFTAGRRTGRLLRLVDNFRSHAGVLAPLNELFSRLFSRSFGGTDYDLAERLTARRAELPNPVLDAAPRLEFWLMPPVEPPGQDDDTEDQRADDFELIRIEREALAVAAEIRALQALGPCIPEGGANGLARLRPLRLSDVVILLRSARGNAVHVARTLRAAGLPCQTSGRDALLDSTEVQDLVQALRLLVNRCQDVPMAGYLRGPLGGLSAADLLAVRRAIPEGSFAEAVLAYAREGPEEARRARLRVALEQLDTWSSAARQLPLPDLLRKIIRSGRYRHFARALPLGAQRVAALDALVQAAEDFHERSGGGPADFLEFLDALSAEEFTPSAPQPAEGEAVQVLTIHAAKGLEYPVVFLLNCGARFNTRSLAAPLLADERGRCGWRGYDRSLRQEVASAVQLPLRLAVQRREREEELRLLYVAATRAREKLYLVGHFSEERWRAILEETPHGPQVSLIARLTAQSVLEWALQAAAAANLAPARTARPTVAPSNSLASLRIVTAATAPEPPPSSPGTTPYAAFKPADAAWIRQARSWITGHALSRASRTPAVVSVSELKGWTVPGDTRVTQVQRAGVPSLSPPPFAATARPGTALGTAVHRFLQFAGLRALASHNALYAERDRLVMERRLTPAEAALLPLPDLEWLGQTDLGKRLMAGAEQVLRELPFVLALPVPGIDESVIVRGVFDALLPTGRGYELIDYKTDDPVDPGDYETRRARYARQIQYYAAAAARILNRPVESATLVFLRRRDLQPVSLASFSDLHADLPALSTEL